MGWEGVRDQQLQRYAGHPVSDMYDEWGAPKNSAPLEDGGYYYEFEVVKAIYHCQARAWTDANRIVTRMAVGGQNGCLTE
jgi:hypothetical protein